MLLGCVKLDDIPNLRCSYLVVRHEDSVFLDSSEEDDNKEEEKDSNTGDLTPKEDQVVGRGCDILDTHDGCALKSKKAILEYQEKPGNMDIQMNLLQQMTKVTAQAHVLKTTRSDGVKEKHNNLQPSIFLTLRSEMIRLSF